jgi:hypothetical protein
LTWFAVTDPLEHVLWAGTYNKRLEGKGKRIKINAVFNLD